MSDPTVKAAAFTARADASACASVWTRTRLKSWPKRDSMNARVVFSSGWPGVRQPSWTIGGTELARLEAGSRLIAERCNEDPPFALHVTHGPPAIVCWPHAHLRRKTLLAERSESCTAVAFICF